MDTATRSAGFTIAAAAGLILGCCAAPALAQPGPVYEKKGTWAETLVALRAQAAGRAELFRAQPAAAPQAGRFGPAFAPPSRDRTAEPPNPLVRLWARLEQDFPLECDWMLQDLAACGYPASNPLGIDYYPLRWLGLRADPQVERTLLDHVVKELGAAGEKVRAEANRLRQTGTPAHDCAWLELYASACQARRDVRLARLAALCPAFVFTKHFNLGGSHYAFTEGLSDAQSERHFTPGAALCLLEMKGTTPVVRTLVDDPTGVIRDPDVAYEGDRVLFAWKKSDRLDDYHLHEVDLKTGRVRQLTHGLGFADYEGAYLPGGDIVFSSSRCVQAVDCFFTEVSNLYACDKDGRFLRRLGFDQVHTNYPTVTRDGRVLYTRWEYNDRGQIFTQHLFQMNPDGTGQTEYYGNNSWFPPTILHAREVPGTGKALAIAAGHHTPQTGKLIEVDPGRGRQENQGVRLLAPERPAPAVRVDAYGQEGELFQYPYPLSETEFLVTYSPWGRGRPPLLFGVYFMTADGRRELLAHDAKVSCNQPVPVRRPPPHARPVTVDYHREAGTVYLQDVYAGPGLAGVDRGRAKRLRVVGLEYRAAAVGGNMNRGEAGMARVCTPVAVAGGSWEVKTVLGETPIEADGSAFFTAPARTPLYFQVVDEKGYVIQTMRSWCTLMPGENASCVGCHEHKNSAPRTGPVAGAARRRPRPLEPFYGPARGFSFAKEIQPILDRHCVRCHDDRGSLPWLTGSGQSARAGGDGKAFSLLGTTTTDAGAMRRFSDGYLALTGAARGFDESLTGTSRRLVNWVSPQSGPPMRAPYSAGAATSRLTALLEEGHKGVHLTREESEKIACWIDLVVPYCGDYREANAWSPFEQFRYDGMLGKRRRMEAVEARNRRELAAARAGEDVGSGPGVTLVVEVVDGDGQVVARREGEASPRAALAVALPRAWRAGDRVRVRGARSLAVTLGPAAGEALVYAPGRSWEWAASEEAARALGAEGARLTARPVALAELAAYRDLAANRYDGRGAAAYPHGTGGAGRAWEVAFGREVEIDKVVITPRGVGATGGGGRAVLVFSDGGRLPVEVGKTGPQAVTFRPRRVTALRVEGTEPARVEVWGRDRVRVAEDLAALAP